ncbi:MAG TPA: beta-L-arabinofuranosidase domain-containing protein [Chitinophagaceae bacterium]|nr:beta-L-arabinofuranosidase domain-containing protein [Chitinophagaceae bacterium]
MFSPLVYPQDKLYPEMFSSGDIRLLDGPFKHARDLNIGVILQYDIDRLLQPFRKEAGLPEKGSRYQNWAGLDGHVGGHYLSALAMNYAATNNVACKQRMEYMIAELKVCQDANTKNNADWGIGYAGGVPNSKAIWSAFKKGDFIAFRAAWVPWYNIHKMYAGLRDAWLYTGNDDAGTIFLKFCDWGIHITASLSDAQMQSMLDTEHGGMNEIFADAYQMTGNEKYLTAAKRFSHQMLLDAMAAGNDNLDNKHANTQVPKAIGFQRLGELSHDKKYNDAGSFFWETVTGKRTLAFGGNSRREFFPGATAGADFINDAEGPESCNSYNMLKLTEDLFRTNPSVKYIDYYERTLYNHILSTQHPVHGGYVYFTPVRPRHYRVYSSPNEAMWCCVGSGMENHGKYNQFIYTHQNDSLFLNLFIASQVNWKEKGVTIRQETKFPYEEQTKLIITEGASHFKLMARYPSWVAEGALKIIVNGKSITYLSHPSSFVAIDRSWKAGDVVQIMLPMHNSIEHLPGVMNYIALLHGPILLGAKTGTENLAGLVADDSRWGHIASGKKLPVDKAPILIADDIAAVADKLVPVKNKPLNFTLAKQKMANPINVLLQPFYQIHDARYMMYWMALTNTQYRSYLDSIAIAEKQKLALQKRTVDFVAPGEQQPEADHDIQKSNSNTGNRLDEFWRDARNEGYFSYKLATRGETDLNLMVRYWGAERGNRKFDIYIDDEKLLTENNTDKWNQPKFQDAEYMIPDSILKGKKYIRVRFQALPGNTAGAVYYIRLVRKTG